jgi:hypothetical protein
VPVSSIEKKLNKTNPVTLQRIGRMILYALAIAAGLVVMILVIGVVLNLVMDGSLPAADDLFGPARDAFVLVLVWAIVMIPVLALTSWLAYRTNRSSIGAPTIQDRITEATSAMQSAASLVDELQAEMQVRTAALERLRVENEQYEKLAAVQKVEAEAVSRLIETVIDGAHAKLGRTTRRGQWLFFLAGMAVSALTTVPVVLSWVR